jgi:hypothetical protein
MGGYSRATRSRLAALPLRLPDSIASEKEQEENLQVLTKVATEYYKVRDYSGKLFACRVYREDELEPDSLQESMFDAPRLRKEVALGDKNAAPHDDEAEVSAEKRNLIEDAQSNELSSSEGSSNQQSTEGVKNVPQSVPASIRTIEHPVPRRVNDNPTVMALEINVQGELVTPSKENMQQIEDLVVVEKRLKELKGICGQIHKGYWSYEWCYQGVISQFHLSFEEQSAKVQIESVTNLGTFQKRIVNLNIAKSPPNDLADGTPEIARVEDIHDIGSACPDTQTPRKSYVHLQCCSEKNIQRKRGMIHRDGRPVASASVAVLDVFEDPDHVCTYNVTICTSLLCGDLADELVPAAENAEQIEESVENVLARVLGKKPPPVEGESIREILDRNLAKLCLQTNSMEWWSYMFCHKQDIRQFHETSQKRAVGGTLVASRVVDAEHILGKYDETAVELPDDEEWKLVVNVTHDERDGWGEGSGAYYAVEYTGGDVCDHPDVTDSVIVAGLKGGIVERSSTVQFFCGEYFDIAVNEDHTCHYIVRVKVPDLCYHPLFKAPVSRKQVMKCLPVV